MTSKDHETRELDALVVGAGFSGIYMLYKLRNELGLNVVGIDRAAGVGGTWYWNRYPGAMSDSESFVYQYSFDRDLYLTNTIESKYVHQPRIRDYLNEVVDRFELRDHITFMTSMTSAHFDDESDRWTVRTDRGITFTCRYLITTIGHLSKTNIPDFPGLQDFEGRVVHTGAWPEDLNLTGKKVAVIGNGSTGNQVITATAPIAGHLTSFQRTPQYSVPAGNRRLTSEQQQHYRDNYDKTWNQVWNSAVAMGVNESTVETFSVSAEERERIFQEAWDEGGGFRFMFETFSDLTSNFEANEEACKFIRSKIHEIVEDPEIARKLTPSEPYARRPLCDSGYYQTFNRPNVTLVSIKENPIERFVEKGIVTADGVLHETDVVVFATGFEAIDGSYLRIDIRGKGGVQLKEHWKDGAHGYLGVMTNGFPNMFMIHGPNGPFANCPPLTETEGDWIADVIRFLNDAGDAVIEPRASVEADWIERCADLAKDTVFTSVKSWIFGTNIDGKPPAVLFYLGGLNDYRNIIAEEAAAGYPSFTTSGSVLTALV